MIEALKLIAFWGCIASALFIGALLLGHFLKTRTKERPDPYEEPFGEGWK